MAPALSHVGVPSTAPRSTRHRSRVWRRRTLCDSTGRGRTKAAYGDVVTISFKGRTIEAFAGQLVVKVSADAAREPAIVAERLRGVLGGVPLTVLEPFDERGVGLIDVGRDADLEATAIQLERSDDVVWAEPNQLAELSQHPAVAPNDPRFAGQWALATIGMPRAWDVTQGSADVVISIIDSPDRALATQ